MVRLRDRPPRSCMAQRRGRFPGSGAARMGRHSTFQGQVDPGGPAALVAPLPLRGQRRDRAKALTGFPIFRARRRATAPRPMQISTQKRTAALVGATELCSIATSAADAVEGEEARPSSALRRGRSRQTASWSPPGRSRHVVSSSAVRAQPRCQPDSGSSRQMATQGEGSSSGVRSDLSAGGGSAPDQTRRTGCPRRGEVALGEEAEAQPEHRPQQELHAERH